VTTTPAPAELIDSLAPFATIPEWLAAAMLPDRVAASLRRHVPELAAGTLTLLECSPDRLRAKADEWLARYTVSLRRPDGSDDQVVLVGRLSPPHQAAPAAAGGPGPAPFGRPGWEGVLPDLRLRLRTQDMDDALPSLPTLVDPAAAAELLQPLLRRAGYRDAEVAACRPVVVRYKPGSRCTIVVDVDYRSHGQEPQPPSPVVVKTHQGDKGETAWAAMTALWSRPETWRDAVRLAEPLAYLPDRRILVQGPVPEECTLKELARDAITSRDGGMLDRLRNELAKTARALAAVHGSGATYGGVATLEGELAEVTEVVERLSLSVPELGDAAAPLLEALTDRCRELPADVPVAAHHDFRPAQVLLHRGEVGFIDFDGACMAEPALDLGRFRAKLRDIGISTLGEIEEGTDPRVSDNLALLDDLCDQFLHAYQARANVSVERVLLWETCDLVTTMLHAWTKVRLARLEPRLATLEHQLRTHGELLVG
jgi:hypothetical protein